MNAYSDWKVYVFGQWIKNGHEDIPPFDGEWLDLLKFEEFKSFRTRHEISDKQLALIKKGFHGWDFPDYSAPKPEEPIMPFGQHKGKYFSQIPQDYWLFLNKQSWLGKWPAVALHVRNILAEMNENAASKEEVKNILQLIK